MKPKKQKKDPAESALAVSTPPEEKPASSALLERNLTPSRSNLDSSTPPPAVVAEKKEGSAQEPPGVSQGNEMTYSEEKAGELLWIRSEDLTALRKGLLSVGKDYVRVGGIVRITASGLDRLRQIVEEGTTFVVQAIAPMNPHIVVARIPGKEDLQRVRVADNTQWAKGMVMTGCVREKVDCWACSVRPRFKGRA